MGATADLFHRLGDTMQIWRIVPHEPPGTIYNPADHTATIVITRQETAEHAEYPATVVAGGIEFAPSDAAIFAAGGPYDVRVTATEAGLRLSFGNCAPFLAWIEE